MRLHNVQSLPVELGDSTTLLTGSTFASPQNQCNYSEVNCLRSTPSQSAIRIYGIRYYTIKHILRQIRENSGVSTRKNVKQGMLNHAEFKSSTLDEVTHERSLHPLLWPLFSLNPSHTVSWRVSSRTAMVK